MNKKWKSAPEAPSASAPASPSSDSSPPRRSWFFEAASVVLGGFVAVIPAGIGLTTFLDPWRRKPTVPKSRAGESSGGKEGFLKVAPLSALTVGTAPQRFPVIADQQDAWNFTPSQPVGAVFLQRISDAEVRCFNATCPHAGCSVACDGKAFVCPCHNSSFELDGQRRTADSGRQNPSPRDLDTLEVDAELLAKGEVWIRFQNFYTGRHDKKPKA